MKKIFWLFLFILGCITTSYSQVWETLNNCFLRGEVRDLINKGDTIFAGCFGDGIGYSTDDGVTWAFSNKGLNNKKITCLLTIGGKIFAGTDSGGIFCSADNGLSWKESNFGLLNLNILSMIGLDNKILTSTKNGNFISMDNGNSWSNYQFENLSFTPQITCFALKGNLIFANNQNGPSTLLSSKNYGAHWDTINTFTSVFEICFSNNNVVVSATTKDGADLFVSSDNGNNWIIKSKNMSVYDENYFQIYSFDNILITCSQYLNYSSIYYSTDSGDNWNLSYYLPENIAGRKLFLKKNKLFLGTTNGIFVSRDSCKSWIDNSIIDIIDLVTDSNNVYAVSKYNGIYHSSNEGDSWNFINSKTSGLPNDYVECITKQGSNILSGMSSSGGVAKSTDNGKSWVSKNNGLKDLNVMSIAADGNNVIAYTKNSGVFLSVDNGENWTNIHSKITNYSSIKLLIYDNIIIACWGSGGAEISTDLGTSWNAIYSTIYDGLKVDSTFYLCGNGLKYSVNNGLTWNLIMSQTGLFGSIVDLEYSKGVYFASVGDSKKAWVAFAIDNCNSWFNLGWDSVFYVNVLSPGINYLFAGSPYSGVYRTNISNIKNKFTIQGSSSACLGDTITYSINDFQTVKSKWIVQHGTIINSTDSNVTILWKYHDYGSISVIKLDSTGVKGSGMINLYVNDRPEKPVIKESGDTLYSNYNYGNQWYLDGIAIPNAVNNTFKVTKSGNYSVKVTINGCSSPMSDEFLGVDDPVVQSVKYEIYPNPAANMLFIKGEPITAKIIITNALGENILETEFVNQLDISSLPVGFYFIRIGNQVEKIVKF